MGHGIVWMAHLNLKIHSIILKKNVCVYRNMYGLLLINSTYWNYIVPTYEMHITMICKCKYTNYVYLFAVLAGN